jgi:hypothetical protein
MAECHYAECRYAECRGAALVVTLCKLQYNLQTYMLVNCTTVVNYDCKLFIALPTGENH